MSIARKLDFPGLTQEDLESFKDSYDNLGDLSIPKPFKATITKAEWAHKTNTSGWDIYFKVQGVPPIKRYFAYTEAALGFIVQLFEAAGVHLQIGGDVDPELLIGETVTVVIGHGNPRPAGGYYTDIKSVLPYVERPEEPVDEAPVAAEPEVDAPEPL